MSNLDFLDTATYSHGMLHQLKAVIRLSYLSSHGKECSEKYYKAIFIFFSS